MNKEIVQFKNFQKQSLGRDFWKSKGHKKEPRSNHWRRRRVYKREKEKKPKYLCVKTQRHSIEPELDMETYIHTKYWLVVDIEDKGQGKRRIRAKAENETK